VNTKTTATTTNLTTVVNAAKTDINSKTTTVTTAIDSNITSSKNYLNGKIDLAITDINSFTNTSVTNNQTAVLNAIDNYALDLVGHINYQNSDLKT